MPDPGSEPMADKSRTDPTMSVALVTRNRPNSLRRTLGSLRDQSVQPAQVVVSDDSDPTHTAKVRDLCDEYDCQYIEGPRQGLYANRNHAMLHCSGTHIRTMDDDHEFPAGHFAECQRAIRDQPATIWIIGEFTPQQIQGGVDLESVECPPELHPRGYSVPPKSTIRTWAIADGASIYPRFVFERGDRMAQFYVFGAAYLEWGSRLYWRGYTISHLPSTYVIHHFDPASRSYDCQPVDMSSRLFAAICHSYLYQRSGRNIILTTAQLAYTAVRFRQTGRRAITTALRNYRAHKASLSLPPC